MAVILSTSAPSGRTVNLVRLSQGLASMNHRIAIQHAVLMKRIAGGPGDLRTCAKAASPSEAAAISLLLKGSMMKMPKAIVRPTSTYDNTSHSEPYPYG